MMFSFTKSPNDEGTKPAFYIKEQLENLSIKIIGIEREKRLNYKKDVEKKEMENELKNFINLTKYQIYKLSQGCCSWHGGISYCGTNGYYICNDGTQSPSCRCSNEDSEKIIDNYQNDYSIYSNEYFYDSYEVTIEELKEENQKLKNTNNKLAFILALIIIITIGAYIYTKIKEEK